MTKKIAIMQPYLFPYIGYWQLMNAVDTFVSYDDVNYINRGWINRNNILSNGAPRLITLSLEKASQNKLINEINICTEHKNRASFLQMIYTSYKKAPFFAKVYPIIEDVMLNPEKNIAKFIFASFVKIADYLGIRTELLVSSEIDKDNSLKGDDKISQMCQILNATHYINPIGGMAIYDPYKFSSKNIDLSFIKTDFSRIFYRQFNNDFINGLSIIDVMMFNSVQQVKEILSFFDLVRKDGNVAD